MFSTVPSFNPNNQKSLLEHSGLFLCLVVFTGAGAKVKTRSYIFGILYLERNIMFYLLIRYLTLHVQYCFIIESTSTRVPEI